MSVRSFLILCLVTVLFATAAVIAVVQRERPETTVVGTGKVLPDLEDALIDLKAISIADAQAAITIVRDGDTWAVEERGGYPVPTERVRAFVLSLAKLEKVEGKTKRADRYSALGVEDVSVEGAKSKLVSFLDDGGASLAQVLVGNSASGGGGVFVRLPGEERAWLARGRLDADVRPREWVDRQIADVSHSDIKRMQVTHADDETLTVEKKSKTDLSYTIVELPEGARLTDTGAPQQMASVFSGLDLEDVQPAETLTLSDDIDRSVVAVTFDGLVLKADFYDVDGNTWMTLQADVDLSEATPDPDAVGAETESARVEQSNPDGSARQGAAAENEDSGESLADKVREINARTQGWIYQLPSWKAAPMKKRLDNLMQVETSNSPE